MEAVLKIVFKVQWMRWDVELEPRATLDAGGLGVVLTFCILSSGQWKVIDVFKEENDLIKLTGLKGHTGCWVGKRKIEKRQTEVFNSTITSGFKPAFSPEAFSVSIFHFSLYFNFFLSLVHGFLEQEMIRKN